MQKKKRALLALLTGGLIVAMIYFSGYQIRLVPNEPDLRPEATRPDSRELKREFALEGGSERNERGFPPTGDSRFGFAVS